MFMFKMTFYVQKTPDGNYHVQNAVGGMLGQHHVHSERSTVTEKDGKLRWSKRDRLEEKDEGVVTCSKCKRRLWTPQTGWMGDLADLESV